MILLLLRATPPRARAGLRWSSGGPRLGAEPPHASAAADRAADETCWPRRAPVTGRSPARATLIFDLFDGTRASWRAFVVDGSAAGVLEPRRSCWCSPQQLPRPHATTGWSQAVAGGRRMPYPANPRGPPRRQSYWRVRLRPIARQGPHHCGSRRCEPVGARHPRPMRWPDILSMSSSRCVIVSSQYGALAQLYVSGRPSVTHSHNYVHALSRGHTDLLYVLCDWASTGHTLA